MKLTKSTKKSTKKSARVVINHPTKTGMRFVVAIHAEKKPGAAILADWIAERMWFKGPTEVDVALGAEYRARGRRPIGTFRAIVVGTARGDDSVLWVQGFDVFKGSDGTARTAYTSLTEEEYKRFGTKVDRWIATHYGPAAVQWNVDETE